MTKITVKELLVAVTNDSAWRRLERALRVRRAAKTVELVALGDWSPSRSMMHGRGAGEEAGGYRTSFTRTLSPEAVFGEWSAGAAAER